MSNLDSNIKRINDKLQAILKNYQLLQKENQQQAALIDELKQQTEKDSQLIISMEEKVILLKAAAGELDVKDKKAFEKNINQYIREIDKCIGILSE